MTTATTIASTAIDTNALTQEQLLGLRDTINCECDHGFDYLLEEMQDVVKSYALELLEAQGIETDAEGDDVEALADALFECVSIQVSIDGLDSNRA